MRIIQFLNPPKSIRVDSGSMVYGTGRPMACFYDEPIWENIPEKSWRLFDELETEYQNNLIYEIMGGFQSNRDYCIEFEKEVDESELPKNFWKMPNTYRHIYCWYEGSNSRQADKKEVLSFIESNLEIKIETPFDWLLSVIKIGSNIILWKNNERKRVFI